MKKNFVFILSVISLSLTLQAKEFAISKRFSCPSKIENKKIKPWRLYSASEKIVSADFENTVIFNGHPTDNSPMVPDTDNPLPKPSIWSLHSRPGNYWLGCTYKETRAMYILNLPKKFLRCASYHVKTGHGFVCNTVKPK